MTNRFEEARQLGPMALLRVRAEVLLEREDIAPEDREELVRTASEPSWRTAITSGVSITSLRRMTASLGESNR